MPGRVSRLVETVVNGSRAGVKDTVVVTGGAGFIGRAVLSDLSERSDYEPLAAVRRPVSDLPGKIGFVGDLAEATGALPFLAGAKAVIHTAARVHMMRERAADALAEFRRVNVQGTLGLASQAAAAGVRRFIFISSIKVNGESTLSNRAFTADDPCMPQDPYGISKLEAEVGLRQLAAKAGMELVIVRPPLVYGPHVKGNFLRLLGLVARGMPLPFANIDNRRSLLNVHNLVDLIVRCIEHPAAVGETLLVSDDEDLSTADLAKRLAAAMGRKPRLFPVPMSLSRSLLEAMGRGDLWQRLFGSLQVSCDRTKALLGWRPPVSAAEGLDEVGRWYIESRKR